MQGHKEKINALRRRPKTTVNLVAQYIKINYVYYFRESDDLKINSFS